MTYPSKSRNAQAAVKPRIKPDDIERLRTEAYERLKELPIGAKLTARGVNYKLVDFHEHEGKPKAVYLTSRATGSYFCRWNDPLLCELRPKP